MNRPINVKVTDCTREDLTEFSEAELSLRVFNEEGLYKLRRNRSLLREVLDELFIYDQEQYAELLKDLDEENEG